MIPMTKDDGHEGKLILRLIKEAGKTRADFARAIPPRGIKDSGTRHYLDVPELGEEAWEKARVALRAMGIDPGKVREEPLVMARERVSPSAATEDFRPSLAKWEKSQLAALRAILKSPSSHHALIYWLDAKLE